MLRINPTHLVVLLDLLLSLGGVVLLLASFLLLIEAVGDCFLLPTEELLLGLVTTFLLGLVLVDVLGLVLAETLAGVVTLLLLLIGYDANVVCGILTHSILNVNGIGYGHVQGGCVDSRDCSCCCCCCWCGWDWMGL